jgi:hypothetical protein
MGAREHGRNPGLNSEIMADPESEKMKSNVTLEDFKRFDARAAKGRAVASAIDNATPIPCSVTIKCCKVTRRSSH